ncbi:MAG: tetratricopeptide repeat protein [Leptolinea sp.]
MRKEILFGIAVIFLISAACTTSSNPLKLLAGATATPELPSLVPAIEPTATLPPTPTPLPIVRIHAADNALFNGDYELALTQYQTAFDQAADDETRAGALYGQGLTYFENDDWKKSSQVLQRIISEFSDSPRASSASFLLGEISTIQEQPAAAAEHFARYLNRRPGILDSFVQEKMGDALADSGKPGEAIKAYLAAEADPGFNTSPIPIDLKIAKALRASGDKENTLSQLQTIYDNPASNDYDKAQANLLLGQIYLEMDDPEQAYARFQDSVNNFPGAFDSFSALSALVDAGQPVNELQRGTIDYNLQKYALAVDAFNRYIKSTDKPEASAAYLKALSLREMELYDESFREFDVVIQNYAGTEYFLKAWREKAYTQWAYLDRFQEAADTMLGFVRLYPADSNSPDFLFEAARIHERGEMLQQAADTWERILNEYPNYIDSYRAIYLSGITYYRMGDYAGAQNRFQRSLVLAVSPGDQAAASFWVGKTQQMLGDAPAARTSWETAAQLDPTGYYSERAKLLLTEQEPLSASPSFDLGYDLARERQEAANWIIKTFSLPPETDLSSPGNLSADLHFQRAHEFHELGLYSESSREMGLLVKAHENNPVELFRLLDPLLELGLNRTAITTSRQILDLAQLDDAATLKAPAYFNHIRFGAYFREEVLQAAQNENIHPFVLFSVLRQESLFEGFVESSAGARGVMQIMPATGQEIASNMGWPPNYKEDDLYRPMISIRLGARYLARQREYFGGNMVAALAAYNAGPGNAEIWFNLANQDIDLFLEIIRYEETRNYLTQISEFNGIYSRLYERMP